MSSTEVHLLLSSLEVKNSEVVVIMAREMALVRLIAVGAQLLCLGECVCAFSQGASSVLRRASHIV
jgi:ribosome biogenesis protein Nip4